MTHFYQKQVVRMKQEEIKQETLNAVLLYVTAPSEEQVQQMKEFLRRKTGCGSVNLVMEEEPGLISGFILRADSMEFDFSARGQ